MTEKKSTYKPRYEEKDKVITKFNFVFDESRINYKTEIPELPTKPRPKPDEKKHLVEVNKLKGQIDQLKEQRRKIKDEYKKGSQNYDEQIGILKKNIDLGKKCLVVLNYDLESIMKGITEIEQKIQKKTRLIRNLQRGPQQQKKDEKKTFEEMTYEQLEAQQDKLSTRVSTANLTKKEQTQINALITKLNRLKMNAPHGQTPKNNTQDIQNAQEAISRLRNAKQNLQLEEKEVKFKISAIEEDIEDFKDQIDTLQQQKRNPENEENLQEKEKLKTQIYSKRDQLAKLESQFETRKTQYQYEQAKIQWIKWASQIKAKIQQQWEAEREQRRRQKLRQKNNQKQGETKQEKKEGEDQKPQRPKINKYQKQIDTCTFLIEYCNGLVQNKQQQTKKEDAQPVKKIEDTLKTDEQWKKLKDVEIIQPKKGKGRQEQEKPKQEPKKTKKQGPPKPVQTEKLKNFTHNIFVQQTFDLVKVVPPTNPQEIEKAIKELNDKLTYFLQNPYGSYEQQTKREGGDRDKPRYNERGDKTKYSDKERKVIKTQDFPILS